MFEGIQIPDVWQRKACALLSEGIDTVVAAPTGSGKTRIFELYIDGAGKRKRAVYTVPTRALANDKAAEWRAAGRNVGLVTGDVVENPEAPIVVATLETQRGSLLRGEGPDLLVLDEYQLLADSSRGLTYELAIALAPATTRLLLLSGSVSNPQAIVQWLVRIGRPAQMVEETQRPVPMDEVALESLPGRPPDAVKGYWQRHLALAIANGLAPILVFAPRRRAAEKLARDCAASLPQGEPLALTQEQRQIAGKDLASMLEKRVAYHHSGLSYLQRAGLIEPLAKTGQLRIVVATTGLAAGINFSLRSVLITDSRFLQGGRETRLQPHELLQMYGRAGRRGIDDRGYALFSASSPRPFEAAPLHLRRLPGVDWPNLLRVMIASGEEFETPFIAALRATERLFCRTDLKLGVERSLEAGPGACGLWVDAERRDHARPSQQWILNSRDEWELSTNQPESIPLRELFCRVKDRWVPFLAVPERMMAVGNGQLIRLRAEGRPCVYVRRVVLGRCDAKGNILLSPLVRRIGRERGERWSILLGIQTPEAKGVISAIEEWSGGRLVEPAYSGDFVTLEFHYGHLFHAGVRDRYGRGLVDPPSRSDFREECRACRHHSICREIPGENSIAKSWRRLGLVDSRGVVTRRGWLTSLFSGGEGFALAVALESPDYPVEEIVWDLANLRAGPRFSLLASNSSCRLSTLVREAAAGVEEPGFLENGLPPGYGEGASELLSALHENRKISMTDYDEEIQQGDVQRAHIEWRSLLRLIASAAEHPDFPRWQELRRAAAKCLDQVSGEGIKPAIPKLTAAQRERIEHRLFGPATAGRWSHRM
ncbi:MAG: DEAD/DEAH box helicase [Verrucomicrobiia bacterium]